MMPPMHSSPFRRCCLSPCVFAFFFAALLLAPPCGATEDSGEIELESCELLGSGGFAAVPAFCGRLKVPENPAEPKARMIELFVAVIPAERKATPGDAFTLLAGGPGQAATTAYVDLRHAFENVARDRDVVLVDQRGTGRSAALDCSEEGELMGMAPDEAEILESLRRCLDGLEGDPRFYTTSLAVEDLERVRKALGYQQLNVYGGSYGTRVGLHYLRRYPDSVRTLILDGVVPADLSLGPGIALTAQQALENVFARCTASTACTDSFGSVDEHFDRLVSSLREQPRSLTLPDPVDGQLRDVSFTYDRFAIATRLLSYAPESVALMPLLFFEAAERQHFVPLAAQAIMVENSLSEALSFGMHNSVVCTEDIPFLRAQDIDTRALENTYLGTGQLDLLRRICEVWPAGIIDDDFKLPVSSDKPILLLSGGADPITPPEYAEQAGATLSNHLHLVGPDMGHILAGVGCVPNLIARYVEAASLEAVEPACVGEISPMPFFTSFNGPQP